jgi:hypothetical protein
VHIESISIAHYTLLSIDCQSSGLCEALNPNFGLRKKVFKTSNKKAMAFAVYHMEKGKGGSGGIGRHIDRIESKYGYTTYDHSDASMRELNKDIRFILLVLMNGYENTHLKKS